jgi:hypothetical protein
MRKVSLVRRWHKTHTHTTKASFVRQHYQQDLSCYHNFPLDIPCSFMLKFGLCWNLVYADAYAKILWHKNTPQANRADRRFGILPFDTSTTLQIACGGVVVQRWSVWISIPRLWISYLLLFICGVVWLQVAPIRTLTPLIASSNLHRDSLWCTSTCKWQEHIHIFPSFLPFSCLPPLFWVLNGLLPFTFTLSESTDHSQALCQLTPAPTPLHSPE